MLIETPYKNGDIVTIKGTNGDEIIGRLDEESADQFTLNKPMLAVVHGEGIGMVPYVLTVSPETPIKLNRRNVAVTAKTAKPIADEYIKSTSSLAI